MNSDFVSYIQQLEAMAFFSAYPLLFAVVFFFEEKKYISITNKKRIKDALSYTYSILAVLYVGFQTKKFYPDYSINTIYSSLNSAYLLYWSLLSIIFCLPVFRKKISLRLIHSFVFLFFLLKDLCLSLIGYTINKDIIRNDMAVYTDSLLLNLSVYSMLLLLISVFSYKK